MNSPLSTVVSEELCRYFTHLAARVDRAVHALPREKLWVKPYSYGNSVGHLVLHLTGNLNHYVGAKIAATGYIRDRPREFNDPANPPAELVLENFRKAIALVVETIRSLGDDGLMATIAEELPIQTKFGLLLVCAAHLNNHIGQMSYLVQAQGHSTQEPPVW
jgi:hypothetical protein